MKPLKNYLNPKAQWHPSNDEFPMPNDKNIPFDKIEDFIIPGGCTLKEGYFLLGYENKKYTSYDDKDNLVSWSSKDIETYRKFEKAYKDEGGKIDIEFSHQGAGEVLCNYQSTNERSEYILLSYLRILYERYTKS